MSIRVNIGPSYFLYDFSGVLMIYILIITWCVPNSISKLFILGLILFRYRANKNVTYSLRKMYYPHRTIGLEYCIFKILLIWNEIMHLKLCCHWELAINEITIHLRLKYFLNWNKLIFRINHYFSLKDLTWPLL